MELFLKLLAHRDVETALKCIYWKKFIPNHYVKTLKEKYSSKLKSLTDEQLDTVIKKWQRYAKRNISSLKSKLKRELKKTFKEEHFKLLKICAKVETGSIRANTAFVTVHYKQKFRRESIENQILEKVKGKWLIRELKMVFKSTGGGPSFMHKNTPAAAVRRFLYYCSLNKVDEIADCFFIPDYLNVITNGSYQGMQDEAQERELGKFKKKHIPKLRRMFPKNSYLGKETIKKNRATVIVYIPYGNRKYKKVIYLRKISVRWQIVNIK